MRLAAISTKLRKKSGSRRTKNFLSQAPWMAVWPGTFVFLVVIGFSLVGDGLRDSLDPRET